MRRNSKIKIFVKPLNLIKMRTKETKEEILERLKIVNDFLASFKAYIARRDKKKAIAEIKHARVSFKEGSGKILRSHGIEGIMNSKGVEDVKVNIKNAEKALNRKDWLNAERFIDYAMAYTQAYNW